MKTASKVRLLSGALVLGLGIALSGCGGGGGGGGSSAPATYDVNVVPALGKYLSGTVTIYNLDGTAVKDATGSIVPATGAIKINVGTNTGPFIVEVKGGSYWDEATQSVVTLANTDIMRALVPSVSASSTDVAVNALTNAAAEKLKDGTKAGFQVASGTTATDIQKANLTVATVMGLPGVDIVGVIPTALDGTNKITGTTAADLVAIKLAALSQVAKDNGTTAMGVAGNLAVELKDDKLDNSGGAGLTAATINATTQTVSGNSNLVASGSQTALKNVVSAPEHQAEQELTADQKTNIGGAQAPNSDLAQAKQFFANLRTGILPYTNKNNTGFLDTEGDNIDTEFNQISLGSANGLQEAIGRIANYAKKLHDGTPPSDCTLVPSGTYAGKYVCSIFNGQYWLGLTADGTAWLTFDSMAHDMGLGGTVAFDSTGNQMTLNGYVLPMTVGATKAKVGNPDNSTDDTPLKLTKAAISGQDMYRYTLEGSLKDLKCVVSTCTPSLKWVFNSGTTMDINQPATGNSDPTKASATFSGTFITTNYRFTGVISANSLKTKTVSHGVAPNAWTSQDVVGGTMSFTGTINGTGLTGVDVNTANDFDIMVGKLEATVDGTNYNPSVATSATNFQTGTLTFTGTTFLSASDKGLKLVLTANATGWGKGTVNLNYTDNLKVSISGSGTFDSHSNATQHASLSDGNGITINFVSDNSAPTQVMKGTTVLGTLEGGRITYIDGTYESLM